MFELFKKGVEALEDAKAVRSALLKFVRTELLKLQGGEGQNLKTIEILLAPQSAQKHLYEAAVYQGQEHRFKEEVQKLADDFALHLPAHWQLMVSFTSSLPDGVPQAANLAASLLFTGSGLQAPRAATKAKIFVRGGEAEQPVYELTSAAGEVTIGRERQVETKDHFFRINAIAFPADSTNKGNKFISRQHAHISWDATAEAFLLFADEGGVPPRNKVKVRRKAGGEPLKLQSTRIGYPLQHGDQIMLGDVALLEFFLENA